MICQVLFERVLTLNYNLRLYNCKKDITDKDVWNKMIDELNKLLFLTELDRTEHVFPNGGLSILSLLAESHISLHTWPEYGNQILMKSHGCNKPTESKLGNTVLNKNVL